MNDLSTENGSVVANHTEARQYLRAGSKGNCQNTLRQRSEMGMLLQATLALPRKKSSRWTHLGLQGYAKEGYEILFVGTVSIVA